MEKDPRFVESGRRGALKRWKGHQRRVVRLDELDADTARLIRALIAANETADTVSETSVPAEAEDDGGRRRLPPAA